MIREVWVIKRSFVSDDVAMYFDCAFYDYFQALEIFLKEFPDIDLEDIVVKKVRQHFDIV